jgi:hypothetical protein
VRQIDVTVDVSAAFPSGQPLTTAATVCLPAAIPDQPIVCFGFPGGGYSRRYFTFHMPGSSDGGEAGWHTSRGWIFVACDHLGCGDSSRLAAATDITWDAMVAANAATVHHVLDLLARGGLGEDVPPIVDPVTIGLGQSMGGSLLILQQGQRATFGAVAILGWSGRHAVSWLPAGTPRSAPHYFPRGSSMGALTTDLHTEAMPEMAADENGLPITAAGFHYDDVPRDIVLADLVEYPTRRGDLPEWATDVIPPQAMSMMSPGAVAPEAATIDVPVFVGVGERDVCPDPRSEPEAYQQASDITVYVCPRMGHMHNFAGTREQLWVRVHTWGEGVAALRRIDKLS